MSLIRALATKRCFPELLQEAVFEEVEKSLKNEKNDSPDRLTLMCIKAVMMQRIMEDRTIKLLFDFISGTKLTRFRDIVEISQWETKPSSMPNMPKSIKTAFQFVFRKPLPIFDGLTLKSDPEYMAVVMEHCLRTDWNHEFRVHIRCKNFRVEVMTTGRLFTVVEAEYKKGLRYSTHWPFIFARIAFLKGIPKIRIYLKATKKRPEKEMREAMNSFLSQFKKGPVIEGPRGRRNEKNYIIETQFTQERIIEAKFYHSSWIRKGQVDWGYVV